MRTQSLLWIAMVVAMTAVSCSTGPAPPKPGTPAYFWAGAQESYRSGDYQKAVENLSEITRGDNEFAARARVWQVVISAGLAQGYSEMSDNYDAGARANRDNPMPFRMQVTAFRGLASTADMDFAEGMHGFLAKDKDPTVLMGFPYPSTGSATPPAGLKKVAGGILVQDSERDALLLAMLQRGVLLSVCRAVGSPDDPAKTLDKFKAPEVRVPRETFLLAIAKELEEQTELFASTKLDQPARLKILGQEALDALQTIPPTKETKALTAKIQAKLKKIRST